MNIQKIQQIHPEKEIELESHQQIDESIPSQENVIESSQENDIEENKTNQKENQILLTDEKSTLSGREKKYLLVLFCLYFIQGTSLGFVGGVTLLLASKQVNMAQTRYLFVQFINKAILSICYYPYSFKFFGAPILDSIFSDKIGKRRTYILPCQYIISFLFLNMGICSFSIWISNTSMGYITLLCFLLILLSTIQDIATDGWILTCLSNTFVHLGASCQQIGQYLGGMFGSIFFINITSIQFNTWLTSEVQSSPILSIDQYCYFTGFMILILTIGVQCCTEESPQRRASDTNKSACQIVLRVLRDLHYYNQNANMKIYVIFLLLKPFVISVIYASTMVKLIEQNQFPKEVLSQLPLFIFPFKSVVSCLIGKYLQRGKELTWQIYACYWTYIDSIIQFIVLQSCSGLGGYNTITLYLVVFMLTFSECVQTLVSVTQGGFNMRISDANVGGSTLTLLSSIGNLGGTVSYSIALILLDQFQYIPLVFTYLFLGIPFLVLMKPKLFKIEKLEIDSWKVYTKESQTKHSQEKVVD